LEDWADSHVRGLRVAVQEDVEGIAGRGSLETAGVAAERRAADHLLLETAVAEALVLNVHNGRFLRVS
jgi:hypothetical protein